MYLYQSNRLETLCDRLYHILATPAADPLQPEIIVVQNPGMARWLSQHIAGETGIAAHLDFPLPATFIWNIFSSTLGELPDISFFNRDTLLWRILSELDLLLTEPSMQEISSYLRDDADGSKQFQLAGKITDLFDQYLVYRPEMLLKWEQGADTHWQAVLWRKLTTNSPMHRATLLGQFMKASEKKQLHTKNLPERVCFFGINSLAPSYLEVIAAISEFTQVHIFHLSPCRQAWDDILPQRLLAMKRQSWRNQGLDDISEYFTTGNPLLASMGALGQEFFSLLMELQPTEIDGYEKPEPTSLLAIVQGDILDLHDRGASTPASLPRGDTSICFHNCHSPMREVQILHDRLLDLFATDPDLKPRDILIMAPDINTYAPFVNGVFGSARERLRIPWSIADRDGHAEQPVLEAFLGLLESASSRFTAPEVMALLENRAILEKFQLSEVDIHAMRGSIRDAGIRWGLNSQQRKQQGLEDSPAHTWAFGLERLLLGYLTGPLEHPFGGIMPSAGTLNNSAAWLGGLASFITAIQILQHKLQAMHTPTVWNQILSQMLDDFFAETGNSQDQEGVRILREKLSDFTDHCRQAAFEQPLGLALIRRHFKEQLASPGGGQAFLAGKVTFCNMVPMRSVPFKVVWLLGMNDLDYPHSQRPPAFDLIGQKPRLGDRSRRDDDRYLFLEALLSARRQLSISWVGRDQQSNTEQPPSVVVAELRDYINRGWQAKGFNNCSDSLTVMYPLQPFSKHCFDGNPSTATYAAAWLPTVDHPLDNTFVSQPLPELETGSRQIDIEQLVRFWNHPVRYFLEQRIGLRLDKTEEQLPESEAFDLDNLEQYFLVQEIITNLLAKKDPRQIFQQKQAAGELPAGELGHILFTELLETATSMANALEPLVETPKEPMEVKLSLAGFELTGWLDSLFTSGRISYRPATCKAKDLLQLWIRHLILSLLTPVNIEPISIHLATDKAICFQTVDDPQGELEHLLNYYRRGLTEPLHFYPTSSHARAKAKSESAAAKAARNAWYSGRYQGGEENDPAYSIALRGHNPLDEQFEELATLFVPILDHLEDFAATA